MNKVEEEGEKEKEEVVVKEDMLQQAAVRVCHLLRFPSESTLDGWRDG